MTDIDYSAPAELYLGRDWETAAAQGSRAFRTTANAIRFALEEAAPVSLHGARLRIGTHEYLGTDLAQLYRSPRYPLPRKTARHRPGPTGPVHQRQGARNGQFQLRRHGRTLSEPALAKSQQTQYRRFKKASEAIRYMIEDMPSAWLPGSFLEVNEQRFEGHSIRALYEADAFPLPRLEVAAA